MGYTRVLIIPHACPALVLTCIFHPSVEVKDISLTDYIQVRHAVYLPHTAGRYAKKQFKKAQMPIVERLVDRCADHMLGGAPTLTIQLNF